MKMKSFSPHIVLAAILTASLTLFAACGSAPAIQGSDASSAKQASKTNIDYKGDGSGYLTVNNNIDEPLVLFAGSIGNNHILGGVKGVSSRVVDFYSQVSEPSGTFLLRAVKEETYRAKGSSLSSDDIVSAQLVTYDKNNPRMTNIDINKDMGGTAVVMLQNDSNMAMEVRLNSPTGPKLTTLAPLARNQKVYMEPNPDGYVFFPIYEYYDKESMSIRSVTLTNVADGYPMNPKPEKAGMQMPVVNFNYDASKLFSPFANLIVSNATTRGAFLLQGSTRLTATDGMRMIDPGDETFELNLQKQNHLTIAGLSIDLNLGASNYLKIPDTDYKAGYNYQVTVSGNGKPLSVQQLNESDTSDQFQINLVNEN